MAYKTPIQTLKNEQEYYDGMKRALIVDPTLLQMYNNDDEDIDFMHIQSQIFETPSSQQLTSLFNDEYSSFFLYVFLYIPIYQVISYARNNLINYIDSEAIPPSFCIDEPEELIFELKNITQLGRERIFNHYTWEKSQEIQLLKKAIIELDSDSMKLIMKSEKIDILWLRKILGFYKYINLTREGMSSGRLSEDETSLIFSRLLDEFPIYDESEPYLYDWYEKTKKINSLEVSEKTYDPEVEQIANDVISLFLKMYWYDYSEYRKQTRHIIDSYINKPCFKDFVSKCRAEFEEEEKERRNCDFSWLPEYYFRDSNPPDTKKKNHLTNIMDAVTHGWFYKNGPQSEEEKNGDGRKKFMTLINECARLNFIKDDNETKARMAYVLTGRNVGFDIDEEKPLVWNYEYKNYLFYLLKFLFKRAPHKIAFSMIDGIGEYASINSITGEMKPINHSEHAEELDMKSFPAFAHSLYEFCPPSKTPKGGGKQITNRSKNSKKQENS